MSSRSPHSPADRLAAGPPEPDVVDALIGQARRLRGGVDALRLGAAPGEEGHDDPRARWRRTLCELAVQQLDDLGGRLDELRQGPPAPLPAGHPDRMARAADPDGGRPAGAPARTRAGSAAWDFRTDEVIWSEELYALFGRTPEDGPLSLDELPSWVLEEDQPALTAVVTDCLIDGRPIDQEFRVLRPDGAVRVLHMAGEPVLDDEGGTASMWAVLRDVSELRRGERALGEVRETLRAGRPALRTGRLAAELREAVLPPWRGPLRLSAGAADGPAGTGTLDVASHYLPGGTGALTGGAWYDAMELPDGRTLLTVGELTGQGVTAATGMATLLGAVRGMAVAGVPPGALMGHLNQVLETTAQPALGSALCCRYAPREGRLSWARAGRAAPLLFRDGSGTVPPPPEGAPLGVTPAAPYGEREVRLRAGDVLVLHTDGLVPGARRREGPDGGAPGDGRLLRLAPRITAARSAQECLRVIVEACGEREPQEDGCVLVARVGG